MKNQDRILSVLTHTSGFCDDCLSEKSGVRPRQTVYSICSSLAAQSNISRHYGKCDLCRKNKLVSFLSNQKTLKPEATTTTYVNPPTTQNWYWEGNIQSKVVSYLDGNGYSISSVADTASRAPGKDIVAVAPDGTTLWVSVKGYPEKSPTIQARHWFSSAIFDLILYRGENPSVQLALALPDGYVTYKNLLPRIAWLKNTMDFTVFWVSEDGYVRSE